MHFELPDCRRCCLCLPLRHGLLIFGYLNLMFALFIIGVDLWVDIRRAPVQTAFVFRGVHMQTQLWFCYFIYILEVIFNVVLLVGAHRKNTRLIRIYYYYGIVTTLASFLTYIVVVRKYQYIRNQQAVILDPFEFALAFAGLVLQCYLLLLIRTELKKLQYQGGQFRYVNHAAEILVESLPPGEGREGRQAV